MPDLTTSVNDRAISRGFLFHKNWIYSLKAKQQQCFLIIFSTFNNVCLKKTSYYENTDFLYEVLKCLFSYSITYNLQEYISIGNLYESAQDILVLIP